MSITFLSDLRAWPPHIASLFSPWMHLVFLKEPFMWLIGVYNCDPVIQIRQNTLCTIQSLKHNETIGNRQRAVSEQEISLCTKTQTFSHLHLPTAGYKQPNSASLVSTSVPSRFRLICAYSLISLPRPRSHLSKMCYIGHQFPACGHIFPDLEHPITCEEKRTTGLCSAPVSDQLLKGEEGKCYECVAGWTKPFKVKKRAHKLKGN